MSSVLIRMLFNMNSSRWYNTNARAMTRKADAHDPPNNGLGSRYRDFEEGGQGHKKTRAEKSDEDCDVIEILFDDALPDSLHHMIALEHRPQDGENGHQRCSLLKPYEPASH